jgi:hypothetical protein
MASTKQPFPSACVAPPYAGRQAQHIADLVAAAIRE